MKINKNYLFLASIVLILVVTLVYLSFSVRTDPISEDVKRGKLITLLFAVEGEQNPLLLAEVLFYNPRTRRGGIIDIPDHTGGIIKVLNRVDRLDALYAEEGIDAYRKELESLLNEPIPYYIVTDKKGLSHMVDLVEGVDIFIANPIEQVVDGYEPLLLPSGSVILDGAKGVDYVSCRLPSDTELERADRNQKFFQALLQKWGDRREYLTQKRVFPYVKRVITTNLDNRGMVSFFEQMQRLDEDRIVFQRVLGTERTVGDQDLLFPHYDGKLIKQTVAQVQQTISSQVFEAEDTRKVALEVLNGTVVNGLAGRTAELFRSFGYDISSIRNAERSNYDYTVVLDRKGNQEVAQAAADIIRCSRVYTQMDEIVDDSIGVTIILGKDFDGRYCKE